MYALTVSSHGSANMPGEEVKNAGRMSEKRECRIAHVCSRRHRSSGCRTDRYGCKVRYGGVRRHKASPLTGTADVKYERDQPHSRYRLYVV